MSDNLSIVPVAFQSPTVPICPSRSTNFELNGGKHFSQKLKQNTFPKQIVDWLITTSKENGYWFSASHSFKRQMDSNNVQFVFQCWRLHKISNEFYFILNCLLVLNNILRKAMRSVIFKRIYKHNCIITVKKSVTFEVACSLHFKLQPIILKIAENNDCENFC